MNKIAELLVRKIEQVLFFTSISIGCVFTYESLFPRLTLYEFWTVPDRKMAQYFHRDLVLFVCF